MVAAAEITTSVIFAIAKGRGVMLAEIPRIKNMLKMLLPTTFPIAISLLPLYAAMRLVASSGSEVPAATIVKADYCLTHSPPQGQLGCIFYNEITSKNQEHQDLLLQIALRAKQGKFSPPVGASSGLICPFLADRKM